MISGLKTLSLGRIEVRCRFSNLCSVDRSKNLKTIAVIVETALADCVFQICLLAHHIVIYHESPDRIRQLPL